jgi:hypothetical protein
LSTNEERSPLDETINRLFEVELGIKGDEVTLQYIRDARATRQYLTDEATDSGGRTTEGLEQIDQDEAVELMQEVDDFVEEFGPAER